MSAPEPQPILSHPTEAAIFLVLTVPPGSEAEVADMLADAAGIKRSVGFRIPEAELSCVVGIGAALWDRLGAGPRPSGLHPFRELVGPRHANPEGGAAAEAVLIGDEDPAFAGGSYVIVQKYLHDLSAWDALSTEDQELIVGRTKLTDLELPDEVKPADSHLALTVITGPDKEERQIMRFNMPFGQVGKAEFGTYYIAYARTSALIEEMLTNMFIGNPPGNTDRILDFSTAMTGGLFFAPSADRLENLAPGDSEAAGAPGSAAGASGEESLRIGSLREQGR